MKKFSSSASLSNNNNCNSNSNYYCSNSKSIASAKITNKLIANQITNDIIKPKAISAAEAKLKNTNKNYSKIASSTGSESGKGGGSMAYKLYNRQEIDANDYSIRLQQPCTSSIDVLSCISTNSSSDSSSTLNNCDYEATATSVAAAAAAATAASSSSSSALNSRKKSIVNDYATADYVMHRPKSSQSQHNPYCKSPAEKPKQHRSKHYSAHGPRTQHATGSGPIYAKKHQHSKKSTHHHNHNHTHKPTTAQYTTASHSLHMPPSTPPSLPPSPPPPLRLSTAKIDRHS